jgi:predicted metalloenzyme YecM
MQYEVEIANYADALQSFWDQHELPHDWFMRPDHIAIKCADGPAFDKALEKWMPEAVELSYVHMNGRRLATALLLVPVTVGAFGDVEWLEIMEPRPERIGSDPVGIDHMEFYYDDFEAAIEVLNAKGIEFAMQKNPNHNWLSIMANGHEFKLNDRLLADIVAAELDSGEATVLK